MTNAFDFYTRVWQPASFVVSQMESAGLWLDTNACVPAARACAEQQQTIGEQLNTWAGQDINWGSFQQKAKFFYETKGWPVPATCGNTRAVKRTKPGKRPTDEMAVLRLASTVPDEVDRQHLRLLQGWPDVKGREHEPSWAKLKTTKQFYESLPAHAALTGRVHSQLGSLARTGRLTSKNPNLQNQPPTVRHVFRAPDGRVYLDYDFSGLEWRILAHIVARRYGDPSLVEEICQGIDPHQVTADGMAAALGKGVTRAAGKIINYSLNYGKTAKGLSIQLGVSEREADAMLEAFAVARPGVGQWLRDAVDFAKTRGYCRTLLGRFIPLPEVQDKNRYKQQGGERQALNYPIQGSAADVVSMAMLRCSEMFNSRLREMRAELVLQVHDELLFLVPEDCAADAGAEVERAMVGCLEGVTEFLCPLAVEGGWGKTWGEC